jgi:hypothetical protein
MPYEIKDLAGSLFRNQKREKDTHPNLTGSARINGIDYWVSCWSKPTKDGSDKWLSLAFKPKDVQAGVQTGLPAGQARAPEGNVIDIPDEDLPF